MPLILLGLSTQQAEELNECMIYLKNLELIEIKFYKKFVIL
jgi:hypothetical protein